MLYVARVFRILSANNSYDTHLFRRAYLCALLLSRWCWTRCQCEYWCFEPDLWVCSWFTTSFPLSYQGSSFEHHWRSTQWLLSLLLFVLYDKCCFEDFVLFQAIVLSGSSIENTKKKQTIGWSWPYKWFFFQVSLPVPLCFSCLANTKRGFNLCEFTLKSNEKL